MREVQKEIMARMQFSAQVFDRKNSRIMLQVKRRIIRAYDALCKEAGIVGAATSFNDPDKEFKLSDYPGAEKKIEKLLEGLSGEIESIVTDGVDSAWNLSNEKNSAMVSSLAQQFGWSEERVNELSRRNLSALQAFKERTDAGMDLSQRVWDFVKHDRQKLEWALGLGLAEGKSAAALSRDVRQYLNEPNKLFRRVRDKHGNLVLSKAAQAYHPGQGVYRSSYKNALRLAVTETNMAYRTADHTTWSKMPFVIGIEIKLSAIHATSDIQGKKYPRPYADMCDELAGVYPKEFKFTGWHPHCRCYVVTKLASRQEMDEYSQLSDEQQKNYHFKDEVREAPKAYNDWIQKNQERIENAKSIPYFIKENPHYTDAALHPEKYAVKPLVLQYDIVDQLEAFRTYGMMHHGSHKFNDALEDALKARLNGNEDAFHSAMAMMGQVQRTNERVAKYLQEKKASKKKQNPIVDTNADIKKTPEEKHRIYESSLEDQFVEILQGEYPHKIYVHVLKRPTEEDYARLLDAAKAYAQTTDVCILPEIHKSEVGIRERLGITSDTRTPDLITGYGYIDVKSPKNPRKIWTNANSASDQGAIGCITNHRCEIKKSSIGNIGKNIISGDDYDKSEVHFLLHGTLYKCNGQGIILGQGSPASRVGFNGYISLRGAKIEIISQKDKRTLTKSTVLKRKEQNLAYRARKRKEKIQLAAEQRHANRSQEREQEIRDFWAKRKEETKMLRKEVAEMQAVSNIKEAADPVDALNSVVNGTITTKTGKTIQTATMEKLRAASGEVKKVVKEFNAAMEEAKMLASELDGIIDTKALSKANSIKKVNAELKKIKRTKEEIESLTNLEDPLQAVKDFSLAEAKKVNEAIGKTINDWMAKYGYSSFDDNLIHAKAKLEMEINTANMNKGKYKTWEVANKAYQKKLNEVNEKLAWIDVKNAGLDLHKALPFNVKSYSDGLTELSAAVRNKDLAKAQSIVQKLQAQKLDIESICKDIDEIDEYLKQHKSKKITDVLNKVKSSCLKGDINAAKTAMADAKDLKQKKEEKDSKKKPKVNKTKQTSEIFSSDAYDAGGAIEVTKTNCNVTEEVAKDYNEAVKNFTWQWDWEIRQVQMGNTTFTSRHGHTIEQVKKRAEDIEKFIASAPKWNGGTTYRGMSVSIETIDEWKALIGTDTEIDMRGTASWSTKRAVSERFARYHLKEKNPLGQMQTERAMYECVKPQYGTSIEYLSECQGEHEILCSVKCKWKITGYRLDTDASGNPIHIFTCTPVPVK